MGRLKFPLLRRRGNTIVVEERNHEQLEDDIVRAREAIITPQQQEQLAQRDRIIDALDEITDRGIPTTEDEVAEAVAKAIGEKLRRLNEMATKKPKPHSCPNCGAPLHDGKCDYCGTTIGG